MSINIREMESHKEYAAFSAIGGFSQSNAMWALVLHLKVENCFKASRAAIGH